jgi:hypothetical protein
LIEGYSDSFEQEIQMLSIRDVPEAHRPRPRGHPGTESPGAPLRSPVPMQQENLKRIAEVVEIELLVADSMEPHRRRRRHHEVKGGSQRTTPFKGVR